MGLLDANKNFKNLGHALSRRHKKAFVVLQSPEPRIVAVSLKIPKDISVKSPSTARDALSPSQTPQCHCHQDRQLVGARRPSPSLPG